MPVHVECAKRTFDVLALYQLRIVMYFLFDTITSIPLVFSIFVNRNLSIRMYTADTTSL